MYILKVEISKRWVAVAGPWPLPLIYGEIRRWRRGFKRRIKIEAWRRG